MKLFYLAHMIKVTNPNTGVESEIKLEGLQSFRIVISHDSLTNYYRTNFNMVTHYKYSLN